MPQVEQIIQKLKTIYDPETPVNIFDLIYDVKLISVKLVI